MSVFEAVSAVMADVQAVGKDGVNAAQHFKFRGVDAVVNAVGPALRKHGVIIAPTGTVVEYDTATTAKGSTMVVAHLAVTFTVWGPDGDSFGVHVAAESFDSGDKATAKAHSVAYRTALLQLLCIPTDEADPDEASYERAAPSREPLADEETRTVLGDRVAALDDRETVDLKDWWKQHLGHKLGDITAREATLLRQWLDDNEPVDAVEEF